MAISKRSNNSGATGGNGMQEIDILKRRMLEDKFHEEKSENTCHCGNGCDFTILGEKISRKEGTLLSIHIRQNNLCPFCRKDSNGKINLQFCVENQEKLGEYKFTLGEKTYQTIYKPRGYKFLPPDEIDEQE